MDSNQYSVNRSKQVAFFLSLTLFVTLIYFAASSYRSSMVENVVVNDRAEAVSDPEALDEVPASDVSTAQQVELAPEPYEDELLYTNYATEELGFELVNDGEVVLGASKVAGCDNTSDEDPACEAFTIEFQPVCSETEVGFGYGDDTTQTREGDGGLFVSKNASIEIWKITSPLPILSGSEAMETTGYEIKYDNPAFTSGVKMIRQSLVAAKYVAPGEEKQKLMEVEAGGDDQDFSVHAQLAWGDGGGSEETIFPELESVCPDQQPSDPNPDKSNKLAQEVMNSYSAPGVPLEPRDYGFPGCLKAPGIDLPEADVFETCAVQRGVATGEVISDLFVQFRKWAECQLTPWNCVKQEIVGLLIDAPYGANHKCNEGFCADQFFDAHTASNTPPGELAPLTDGVGDPHDPTITPHYVTTPCKVKVIDNVVNGIYEVPCIWDLSPYKARYDAQAAIREPGDPEFPTWTEYWNLVMAEAKRRGEICQL